MELQFKSEEHLYQSINDPGRKWTSVTTLIGFFKEKFDQQKVAESVSKKKKSKWYGIPPERIIATWNAEANRANTCGTWYHNQREKEVISCETIRRDGLDLPIFCPITEGDMKISPAQELVPGIYPEHFMYLKSANICGQADRVEVVGDRVDVYDYKTNKKIDLQSYVNWDGVSKKMHYPLEHLDDCNLMHYALQLSIYMYIVLKHNPGLKPGKLIIQHVTFEWDSVDEFGFPTIATDPEGNPIIKEVVPYEVPYLKKEVMSMLKHLEDNPDILLKHD